MTDREKLIELIGKFCGGLTLDDVTPPYGFENLADHLISNGVTFKTWIPVSEQLPEEEELVLIICKNGALFVGYYKRCHYNNEISWGIKTALNSTRWLNKGRVTHWMPLPELPNEDVK